MVHTIRNVDDTHVHQHRKLGALLWVGQAALALLFLFAGSMKFVLPIEMMTEQMPFPGWFLYFIGACEVLGGLGLVLPGLTRIQTWLTWLAASGLVIIMVGATVLTVATMDVLSAPLPFVTGLIATGVAYGRGRIAPLGQRSRVDGGPARPAIERRAVELAA